MSNIIDKIRLSGVTYTLSGQSGGGNPTVELTQAEYDALVSAGTVSADTYYIITDAQGGDLSNYWTSAQTQSAINQATSGKASQSDLETVSGQVANKQDTLVSGTNIKTINNTSLLGSGNIDIQGGGGKAIEAGRGISITTGETADTVSISLPISAGTGFESLIIGKGNNEATGSRSFAGGQCGNGSQHNVASGDGSFAFGRQCSATSFNSTAFGGNCLSSGYGSFANGGYTTYGAGYVAAIGDSSHAEGNQTSATSYCSHSEGYEVLASNDYEHSQGRYNVSNKANTTWGDSGNTLFSVGNGTADNARHNAFEIRQNGDIYLSSGGTDIKLQDHLGGGGGSVNVVQTTGTSTTDVMSQDAVTTAINTVSGAIPSTYVSAISIDSVQGWMRFARFSTPSNFNYLLLDNPKINGTPIHKFTGVESQINQFSLVETSAITTSVTSSSTDSQVPSAKAVNDKLGGLSLVKLTQAQYDALATKDNSTLYVIVN